MAWGLDVKHPRYLALYIKRTPDLSVKSAPYTREITVIEILIQYGWYLFSKRLLVPVHHDYLITYY